MMKVEIELPPLPGGWANGPVDIAFGKPPSDSLVLSKIGWQHHNGCTVDYLYAVRKWQPAIVTAGVLSEGWVVINDDCSAWFCKRHPRYENTHTGWVSPVMHRLCLCETPRVAGENAIWEIK